MQDIVGMGLSERSFHPTVIGAYSFYIHVLVVGTVT